MINISIKSSFFLYCEFEKEFFYLSKSLAHFTHYLLENFVNVYLIQDGQHIFYFVPPDYKFDCFHFWYEDHWKINRMVSWDFGCELCKFGNRIQDLHKYNKIYDFNLF